MKNKKHIVFLLVCSFSFILLFFGCKNSTEDSSSETKIEGKSYVPGTLPGTFGSIVANKMSNKTAVYDSDCENFFLTADSIDSITELSEWHNFMKHLLSGKTVVFVAPTYSTLCDVDTSFRMLTKYTDEQFKELLEDIDVFSENAYAYICQVADETSSFLSSSVEDKGDTPVYEIVALRGPEMYYIENVEESVKAFGKELEEEYEKEESKKIDVDFSATEDMYNLFVPDFIDWLNGSDSSSTTDRAVVNAERSVSLGSGAGEKQYNFALDDTRNIVRSNYIAWAPCRYGSITDLEKSGQNGMYAEWVRQNTAYMHVQIVTNYWSISEQTNDDSKNPEYNDYLVFEQEIYYFNNELGCSTDQSVYCWYDKCGYKGVYGPYFGKSTISNTLTGGTSQVQKASPQTTSRYTSYTKGVDLSISGNLSLDKDGFIPGTSAEINFADSTTATVSGVSTEYNEGTGFVPMWTFNNAQTLATWDYVHPTHYPASETLRSTMVIKPSWYWKIDNADKQKYTLQIYSSTTVDLLNYYIDIGYITFYEDYELHYTSALIDYVPICAPCRNKTKINVNLDWTGTKNETTGEIENSKAKTSKDDISEIENILEKQVDSYYPVYSVFTAKDSDTTVDLNSDPAVQKQVKNISKNLETNVTNQISALQNDNFYKYGVMTFEFHDEDDNLIESFDIDFTKK